MTKSADGRLSKTHMESNMNKNILMIHGMWGTGDYWDNFRKFFELNKYQCHTPTLPYHNILPGEKPDPSLGKTGIKDYVEFISGEVDKLDAPLILMGHSLGGLIAQLVAVQKNVDALILLSSTAPRGIFKFDFEVFKCFWGLVKRGLIFCDKPVRMNYNEATYAVFHQLPEEERKAQCERMVYESGRVIKEVGLWPLLGIGEKITEVDENEITCPVLVISGCKDRLTPLKLQRAMAEKLSAEYKEFSEKAHWIIGEKGWEDVADYIFVWLNEVLK